MTIDRTVATPFDIELLLFDKEPLGQKDNVVFGLADNDIPFAHILLDTIVGTNVTASPAGQLLYKHAEGMLPHPYTCETASKLIYGLLVVRGAMIPVSEDKFKIYLALELD